MAKNPSRVEQGNALLPLALPRMESPPPGLAYGQQAPSCKHGARTTPGQLAVAEPTAAAAGRGGRDAEATLAPGVTPPLASDSDGPRRAVASRSAAPDEEGSPPAEGNRWSARSTR